MKKITLFMMVAVSVAFSCFPGSKSENEKITTFLTEMADARMMDREEGRLAAERGTTKEIRDYGNLMVKDQTFLLDKLEALAKSKNVALPATISDDKSKALDKLKEKSGADFDKKFLNMIKIDHKRDVRKFKKATKLDDVPVRDFAVKYQPMIQKHLEGVKEIKSSM